MSADYRLTTTGQDCRYCGHLDSRLTVEDNQRISAAVVDYLDRSAGVIPSERFTTAERIAHAAIGCTAADLRPVELADIAATVRRLMAPSTP